ncbi:galc [Symbiodinium sp. CCMP2592]|nr:galc [Symbiodinium sp. CCMP2592]
MRGVAGLTGKWITAILWCLRTLQADALGLESAEFARGFTTLVFRFTENVNVSALSDCDAVLPGASLQKMGTAPQCQWLLGGLAFQVMLGHQPTLELGDVIELLPAVGSALQATVNSSDRPEAVASLKLLPAQVQRCGLVDVAVDASLSSGGAGRPLQAEWRTGAGSQLQAGQVIQDLLAAQNGTLSFTLPATSIASAVDAAVVANASLTMVHVEVVLAVTNWLGLTSETSAMLEVDLSEVQLPVLEASPSKSIRTNQSVTFNALARYAQAASCTTASSANVSMSWEYRSGSGPWLSLENASLQENLITPWMLRFAPFSFSPGSSHQLRVNAAFSPTQVRQHVFQLDVAAAAPMVPVVTGPSLLPETCELVLDASQSFDPDHESDPQYFWSCAANSTAFNCHSLSNFRTVTWTNTDGSGASGEALRISAGQLVEDLYTFNVTVIRASDRASFEIASWMVQVLPASAVPITVSVPWYANQPISGQLLGEVPEFTATVLVSDACGMSADVEWVWALVSNVSPFKILLYLDTSVRNLTLPGEISVAALGLPASGFLVPGDVYAVALLESSAAGSLADLAEAATRGLRFARSVPFLADGAPTGGYVTTLPSVGTGIETEFLLATSGWFDEDLPNSGLVYRFYRFPLPPDVSLVANSGSFSVSGAWSRPSVDWRNKSSANFWSKLGGIFLAEASDASSLRVALPPGEHMLGVVAEDGLGAVSSSWFVGPLVQVPSDAASVAAVALNSALRLGDAQNILNTLAASAFTKSDDLSEEVAALVAALMTLDTSDSALSQVNAVVVELLKEAVPDAAARVSQFLAALFASIVSPTTGLDYLLEALLLIKIVYDQEAWLRTDELRELLAKCGDAVLVAVPGSSEKRVQSLDHLSDGKGLEVAVREVSLHDAVRQGMSVAGFSTGPLSEIDGQAGCGTVTGQVTTWRQSNPYAWPNVTTEGVGADVTNVTDVHVIEMRRCGSPFNITGRIVLDLPLPEFPTEPALEGYAYQPACIVFDAVAEQWTTDGLWRQISDSLPGTLKCSAVPSAAELIAATVVYRLELVPVVEEPPSVALIIVAIIVFLLCMAGLAYANMKKSEGKKDKAEDVEAAVSSRVAPAPESDEPSASPEEAEAQPAKPEASTLVVAADAPALPPLPSASSGPSRAEDPGSPAEALVPKPQLDSGVPVQAPVSSPEFESFAEGFKTDLPTASEEAPAPPGCFEDEGQAQA